MIIHKHIEKKILRDYFVIEGSLKINCKYFIDKIKEGVQSDDNRNHQTYVRDQMTSWEFFKYDDKFLKILSNLIDMIDENFEFPTYGLVDAWGYCLNTNGETREHDHKPNLWSGVLYLNNHDQTLNFSEIKQSFKPAPGKFVLFSSHLLHDSKKHKFKKSKYGISFNMMQNNFK